MGFQTEYTSPPFESLFANERPRLVRLCAYLSGSADVAEDLTQETLVEAWRQRHKLIEPEGVGAWMGAIARNVCLRWARRHGREQTRIVPLLQEQSESSITNTADTFDLEVELDRDELATLLDRALALLPPETRTVLIQKYVNETPLGEIAGRLGTTEGTAAVRLHRGKLALRQIFANELRDDAVAYGLMVADDGWRSTRIWCPFCGQQKLAGVVNRELGYAAFSCPDCPSNGRIGIAQTHGPEIMQGVSSYKSILSRQISFLNRYYRDALSGMTVPCYQCKRPCDVHLCLPPDVPIELRSLRGIHFKCLCCGWSDGNPLRYLALDLPATQQFWRVNPRMHVLPDREINYAGHPAILTTFASDSNNAHLDIISAVDSFAVLDIVEMHAR